LVILQCVLLASCLSSCATHTPGTTAAFTDCIELMDELDSNAGITARGTLVNGIREGIWRMYYSPGNLESMGAFRAGERIGLWEYWYHGGRRRMLGEWSQGERIGLWVVWNNGGEVNEDESGFFVHSQRIHPLFSEQVAQFALQMMGN
jgi:antitoxin component YwqK of YwqJK toxin-antitoxin module